MSWHRVFQQDIMGLRFALNVFIATIITWSVLKHIADTLKSCMGHRLDGCGIRSPG